PLLLDNAYGEFCQRDYLALLRRHRKLIVFRTFSKAWSLGGLRLGYLMADPALVEQLLKVKLPYNVGFAAAQAGLGVLRGAGAARRRVAAVLGRRPQWAAMLRGHGFEVFPSEANFLLVRMPQGIDARELAAGLTEAGIRIRDVGAGHGLAGC